MASLGVLRYEVRHGERLQRQGLLMVANHPSLIHVVLLIALVRRADCVVKAALVRKPFTRGPVLATGYVCNDWSAGMVADCVALLLALQKRYGVVMSGGKGEIQARFSSVAALASFVASRRAGQASASRAGPRRRPQPSTKQDRGKP